MKEARGIGVYWEYGELGGSQVKRKSRGRCRAWICWYRCGLRLYQKPSLSCVRSSVFMYTLSSFHFPLILISAFSNSIREEQYKIPAKDIKLVGVL